MVQEIREGRGCGPNKDHLHIHFSHLDPAMLKERLPEAFEQGRTFANVDILKEPIPIVPTVHYCMGGISTNYHGEVLTLKDGNPNSPVPGLMAVGRWLWGVYRQVGGLGALDRWLLRPRHERPSRHAPQRRDELSAFDHSITSSARSRIDFGTVSPSALAVLRFTAISYFAGN